MTLPQEGASATAATEIPWFVSTERTAGANSEDRDDRLAFIAGNQTVIENFSAPESQFVRNWTAIAIPVTVNATDNLDSPFDPTGLKLNVAVSDNIDVPLESYALGFADGLANTTVTVLASVTLAGVSSLVQTVANTALVSLVTVSLLDNNGDPIGSNILLQFSASNGAIIEPPQLLNLGIPPSGLGQILFSVRPQNDLDTTVTVQVVRSNLDPDVQIFPEDAIAIPVRALRVLRQLQLNLTGREPPLQQIDAELPIRANIRLIGLDQYGQPIAFPEVMLTATADPSTTQVTLEPQQVESTRPEGVSIVLGVAFPEPLETTITIAIADPGTGITENELVIQALPFTVHLLNVDDVDARVTELDLIVALRFLEEPQSTTASLLVNLTLGSANITTAGIGNLRQLFNEESDSVDINSDGRADHLDLRILLRYASGLRDTALSEQEVSEAVIRRLLGNP